MTESSNNNYNAADIERYHAGRMSAAEMHALEKAAMEDPFLADALEGYAYAATPQRDLDQIRTRLFGEKKDEKKAVPFIRRNYNWLKAAAIIIFVAGGAWLAFQVSNPKKAATGMAVQKKEEKKPIVTDTIQQNNFATAIRQSKQDTLSYATVKTGAFSSALTTVTVPDSSKSGNSFSTFLWSLKDSANNKPNEGTVTFQSPPNASLAATLDTAKFKLADNNVYYNNQNGIAYNKNLSNMSGTTPSTILLPSYNNNNSYKSVERKRSDSVTAFMKESKAKPTDSITNLNIVLQPDNAGLEDVVVSANKKPEAKKQEADKSFELKVDTLAPKEGWEKFDDYIARNIQVPDELKSKQPYAGEVELEFDINKNGEPINITVTRSLCEKCDQEAIRLLKEGPKWKKKKSKKGKVTIKF